MVHLTAAFVRDKRLQPAFVIRAGLAGIAVDFDDNRSGKVLYGGMPQRFERAFHAIGIALDPFLVAHAKPVPLARLRPELVVNAVKVRNDGIKLLLRQRRNRFWERLRALRPARAG